MVYFSKQFLRTTCAVVALTLPIIMPANAGFEEGLLDLERGLKNGTIQRTGSRLVSFVMPDRRCHLKECPPLVLKTIASFLFHADNELKNRVMGENVNGNRPLYDKNTPNDPRNPQYNGLPHNARQAFYDALYNAPDAEERAHFRSILRPILLTEIQDSALKMTPEGPLLQTADDRQSISALKNKRDDLNKFVNFELRAQREEGRPLNVFDMWVSGEIRGHSEIEKAISELPEKTTKLEISPNYHFGIARHRHAAVGQDYWQISMVNKVCTIPSLARLTELRELDIYGDDVSNIEGLDELDKLEGLGIFWCQIDSLEPFGALQGSLKHLTILSRSKAVRPLTTLKGLRLQDLESLSLINTSISSIEECDHLENLKKLVFSNNALTSLSGLDSLVNLESLEVDGNKITSISELLSLTKLRKLDISDNSIQSLKGIEGMTKLEHLKICQNKITSVSECSGLTNLKYIQLSANPLTSLAGIENLSKLEVVSVEEDSHYSHLKEWPKVKDPTGIVQRLKDRGVHIRGEIVPISSNWLTSWWPF